MARSRSLAAATSSGAQRRLHETSSGLVTEWDHIFQIEGDHNRVSGNYIGVTADGKRALVSSTLSSTPLYIHGTANTIGGSEPADRNLILDGVGITGDQNVFTGNSIGTDSDGEVAIRSADGGLIIQGTGNTIDGNVIAAESIGIEIFNIKIDNSTTGQSIVSGNFVGTNTIHLSLPVGVTPPQLAQIVAMHTQEGRDLDRRRFQRAAELSFGAQPGALPRLRGREEEGQDHLPQAPGASGV